MSSDHLCSQYSLIVIHFRKLEAANSKRLKVGWLDAEQAVILMHHNHSSTGRGPAAAVLDCRSAVDFHMCHFKDSTNIFAKHMLVDYYTDFSLSDSDVQVPTRLLFLSDNVIRAYEMASEMRKLDDSFKHCTFDNQVLFPKIYVINVPFDEIKKKGSDLIESSDLSFTDDFDELSLFDMAVTPELL